MGDSIAFHHSRPLEAPRLPRDFPGFSPTLLFKSLTPKPCRDASRAASFRSPPPPLQLPTTNDRQIFVLYNITSEKWATDAKFQWKSEMRMRQNGQEWARNVSQHSSVQVLLYVLAVKLEVPTSPVSSRFMIYLGILVS